MRERGGPAATRRCHEGSGGLSSRPPGPSSAGADPLAADDSMQKRAWPVDLRFDQLGAFLLSGHALYLVRTGPWQRRRTLPGLPPTL